MITRTVTIAGGSFSANIETPEALPAAHVQYFDAADQISRRPRGRGIAAFAIAHGQTTASLAQALVSKNLANYARRSGNCDAAAGLSGSLQVGSVAAQFTVSQPQFQQFIVKGRSEVVIQQGGNVGAIEDSCLMGSGGGVGGGAGATIHRAKVLDYLRAGFAVRSHRVRLGPMAHTGVRTDNAIQQNAAATICTEMYSLLHDRLMSPFETRELTLVECPPCGNDDALRDYYARTLAQALLCPAVRDVVTAQTVNGANNLKCVSIVQAGWYGRIAPREIQKAAYADYSPTIKRLKSPPTCPKPVPLSPITLSVKKRNVVNTIDFLSMALSSAADLRSLVGHAARSPNRYGVRIEVRVESGKVDLRKLDRFLNSFGPGYADFCVRREFVAGLLPEITKHLADWKKQKRIARRRLKAAIIRLAFVLVWSFARGGVVSRIASSAQLSVRKLKRLRKHFEAVRSAALILAQCIAVTRLLARTKARLRAEQRRMQRLIANIDNALDAFEPFHPSERVPVEMATIAEAWPYLTELTPDDDIANGQALVRLARRVTASGLQTILSARDFDTASLAKAIATAEPTEGPHWGNDGATRHYHSTYYVLPPLPRSLQSQLEDALFGTGALVKFAESCAGGVTAVRLRFSTPQDASLGGLREIFTPQLRAAFKETLSKSRREEHYPQGDAAWQWLATHLGIRLPARSARINEEPLTASGATNHK